MVEKSGTRSQQSPSLSTVREPKQDRSRATQKRLLESTVSALSELGWTGATTSEIARRSGVSRGSLQHHFRTREELIVAALTYLFNERTTYLLEQVKNVGDQDRYSFVADLLFDLYVGELFSSSLQVWTAAMTDDKLRDLIVPLEERFARKAFGLAVSLLNADVSDEHTFRTVQVTLDLARGLGLANVLTDDSDRRNKIKASWIRTLRTIKTKPQTHQR